MSQASGMPSGPGWWQRLERRREAMNHTLKEVAGRVGLTSQTLYNWRDGGRPDNADAVRGLAEYLQEDFDSLLREIRREPAATDVLRGYPAWDFGAAQNELARVLLSQLIAAQEPGDVMLEALLRLLRHHFPAATISFQVQWRGNRRRAPFQYAVHVEDRSLSPEDLRNELEQVLSNAGMPVSLEHSRELLPEHWRVYPVVLVPIHLAPREARLSQPSPMGGITALILGVWYSGAPDISATAAARFGAGATSITNLAASFGTGWDARSKRAQPDLEALQVRLAERITSELSPVPGPFIWSNNDVPPVLHPDVQARLRRGFRGRLIVLELDDELLEYAAYRSHTASGQPVERELQRLRLWQDQLTQCAVTRSNTRNENGERPAVARILLHKPREVTPQKVDGQQTWPDAVNELFDLYCEVGESIGQWLTSEVSGLSTFEIVMSEARGWALRERAGRQSARDGAE